MDIPFFNHPELRKPYTTWYTPGVFFGNNRPDDNFFRVISPDGDYYPQQFDGPVCRLNVIA